MKENRRDFLRKSSWAGLGILGFRQQEAWARAEEQEALPAAARRVRRQRCVLSIGHLREVSRGA
ncbi:MAG: hypothetical protein ACXIT9_09955 [Nitritalea sp.]